VTNTSDTAQNFSVTLNVALQDAIPLTANASAAQSYNSLGSGQTAAFGPFSTSATGTTTLTSAGDKAPYIGNGTISFATGTLTGETILGGGGNITSAINTTAGISGTLVYNFTRQIPEIDPSAASGVLALLVGGICTLRGRRRST
jgi:hypothetical protein